MTGTKIIYLDKIGEILKEPKPDEVFIYDGLIYEAINLVKRIRRPKLWIQVQFNQYLLINCRIANDWLEIIRSNTDSKRQIRVERVGNDIRFIVPNAFKNNL